MLCASLCKTPAVAFVLLIFDSFLYAGLTEEERAKEDAELIKAGLKKDPNARKKSIGFMQK